MLNRSQRKQHRARRVGWTLAIAWFVLMYFTWFARFERRRPVTAVSGTGWTQRETFHSVGLFRNQDRRVLHITAPDGIEKHDVTFKSDYPGALMGSAVLSITTALAFWWIPIFIARDGRRPGQCVECGYDLRGTTSSQCPECGAKDSRKT